MNARTSLRAATACLLACSVFASAQEKGYWRATSTTAKGVTGDVTLSEYKLTINFASFTIAEIRDLKPEEMQAAFGESATPAGAGHMYRLSIPASLKFLHKNTLCGSDDTQWMATDVAGKTLQVAFFSGETMPVLAADAMKDATNLCGTYTYSR